MPKRSSTKRSKRNASVINQLATEIVNNGTETQEAVPKDKPRAKNPAAVALGRLGGKKGGRARAEKLSDEQRSAIAKRAAEARWRSKE